MTRRALEHVDIPGEHEARERTWTLVQEAFAEREPAPRRRIPFRPVVALAVVAGLAAAALSPPGRALIDEVREAVGVEQAQPALFALPDGGRVLVSSDVGAWVVQPDGSKRLLGRYDEASWSPFGRFVVAARSNELVALEPNGDVRWKLSRPAVRSPRWGGTRTDTRIAYLSGGSMRVVGGDGAGDHSCAGSGVADVPGAWRPGRLHVLALASTRGEVSVYAVDRCALRWRTPPAAGVRALTWSRSGNLLVVGSQALAVYGPDGRRRGRAALQGVVAAAYSPDGRQIAALRATELIVFDARLRRPRRMFGGVGRFTDVAWSPDGRWLLVGWRDADQWVFVRAAGRRKIDAVSGVSAQFESATFPTVAGWCCAPG